MTRTQAQIGGLQIGIIVLTIATALVHLGLGLATPDIIFILNGLGYLALVGALYLPIAPLAPYRALVRWVLVAFAAVTIVGWIVIGDKSLIIGYPTKVAEVILIVLLVTEARQK
jgi:hypothetical protein